jgi:hypothetical protein
MPKWFDKLTTLSNVEGQTPMIEIQHSKQMQYEISPYNFGDIFRSGNLFWSFDHSNFEFVSDFDIRISSFGHGLVGALKTSADIHRTTIGGSL